MNETIADVLEALEDLRFWKPIYEALLKTCRTKAEALDTLKWLVKNMGRER